MNKTIECPCCAGSGRIEEKAPVPLSPMQFRIFDIVRGSKDGITGTDLVNRIYAGVKDGGPLSAYHTVMVQVTRANKRLARKNLRIATATGGRGSPFHLQHLSSE